MTEMRAADSGDQQYFFPVPAKAPKTEVLCSACPPGDGGKRCVGYQGAISSCIGRYNDSGFDSEGFSLPRPLRAWQMKYDAAHDRLYMRVGSFLVAYDLASLLTRLQAGEPLQTIYRPGDVPAGSYLNWDKSFNIEASWPQSGMDGGDWLPDFDYDDRGYVFCTEGVAWGSVQDDWTNGGQFIDGGYVFPAPPPSGSARSIVTVKTSDGRYWVGVSPENATTTIFDVTDRTNPVQGSLLERAFLKTAAAKSSDNHWVAIVNAGNNAVEIFTAEDFVSNNPPTFSTPAGRTFRGMTSDGTNFYSAEYLLSGKLSISTFVPSGQSFVERTFPTDYSFLPERLKYGSGHVSVNGMYPATSTNDVFVFKVEGGTMKELALLAYSETSPLNSNRYVPSYYSTRGVPAGYLSTIYSLVFDTFVVQPTGPANLLINAKAFGDVYAIQDPG